MIQGDHFFDPVLFFVVKHSTRRTKKRRDKRGRSRERRWNRYQCFLLLFVVLVEIGARLPGPLAEEAVCCGQFPCRLEEGKRGCLEDSEWKFNPRRTLLRL